MTNNKSLIFRWAGEALVIIFSVFIGFWTENYRQERKENDEYLKTLTSFRNTIYTEIGEFREHYDTTINGYLIKKLKFYSYVDSLLHDNVRANDFKGLELLVEELKVSHWIDPNLDMRITDNLSVYSFQLISDSIEYIISGYQGMKGYAFTKQREVHNNDKDLLEYLNKVVDLGEPDNGTIENINIIFLKNSVAQQLIAFQRLLQAERSTAHTFKAMVKNIDKVLIRRDIETQGLKTDFLNKSDFD